MNAEKLNRVIQKLSTQKMSPEMKEMIARMNKTKKRVESSRKLHSSSESITISSGI